LEVSGNWPHLDQDTQIDQTVRLRYSNRAVSDSIHSSVGGYEVGNKDSYAVYLFSGEQPFSLTRQ